MRILILNGPNLNLLGLREPHIYGHTTLADIREECHRVAGDLDVQLDFRQSNHEGELVTWIQQARNGTDAIILNAGAYTHTSIAIHDALKAYDGRIIELHVSNPQRREAFRQVSYIAPVADAVIAGFGTDGYISALRAIAEG